MNEELKTLSVYSLTEYDQSQKSGTSSITSFSSSNKQKYTSNIHSIQEHANEGFTDPPSASEGSNDTSPMKRTSSFSAVEKISEDVIDGKIKRSGSHGKLVNLYGNGKLYFLKLGDY